MEYHEFVEELEKSLLDQMKGETAFSIQAQTIQNNGEDQKEILYCRAGENWGLPLPAEEAYDDFLEGRKDRTENGEADEALYRSGA